MLPSPVILKLQFLQTLYSHVFLFDGCVHPKKRNIRQFHFYVNISEYVYTSLDGMVFHIPRLFDLHNIINIIWPFPPIVMMNKTT